MPIDFDYTIERDEGVRIRRFSPTELKGPFSNIVTISAPNSSGKSTLLNIIALALFGSDHGSDGVSSALLEQIKELTNLEIQKLTFKLKITDITGMNGIIAEKRNSDSLDITRKEIINGEEKIIDSVRFNQKYRLIYDIPDKPLERLQNLTSDIRLRQILWRDNLRDVNVFLSDNLKEILRTKEEFDLDKINGEIEETCKNLNFINGNVEELEKELSIIKKYRYYKLYLRLRAEYEEKKEKDREIKGSKAEYDTTIKSRKTEFNNKAKESGIVQDEIKGLRLSIMQIIFDIIDVNKLREFSKWQKIALQTPTAESLKVDKKLIEELQTKITEEFSSYRNDSETELAEFYSKLIDWIRANASKDYPIPGTELSLDSLIKGLQDMVDKNSSKIKRSKKFDILKKNLDELKEKSEEFLTLEKHISETYREMSKAQREVKTSDISTEIRGIKAELNTLKKQMEETFKSIQEYGNYQPDEVKTALTALLLSKPSLGEYESLSDSLLVVRIGEKREKINRYIQRKQQEQTELEILKKRRQKAQEIKPHKYGDNYEILKKVSEYVKNLISILSNYDRYMDDYSNKNITDVDLSSRSDKSVYFINVSKYLALRMKTLIHISRKYDLSEVDIINSRFKSTDGTIIHFSVMGTGQRQLAYLLNTLNFDGRKIFAIFDEVSTMDKTTMNEVIKKMKELETDKKLLMGIMVFPSEDTKVINW